jgi:hypothetical protein
MWEQVESCPPAQRGLALLETMSDAADARSMTIGGAEERLLALHETMFGSLIHGFARCPLCSEALELTIDIAELRATVAEASPNDSLHHRDYEVRYRPLSVADLVAASGCDGAAAARSLLLERAIVSAMRRGQPIGSKRLPKSVAARLAQSLAESDPWAESLLSLRCPECSHEWTVLLDVAVFLWTALRGRAQQLLYDVHTLATAYGWREADILAMSPRRREAYLTLVGT